MKKITLAQVKKMIREGSGQVIRLVPCKMSPVGMWGVWHDTSLKGKTLEEFDKIVNSFYYYNCNNETGNRIHYYIVE